MKIKNITTAILMSVISALPVSAGVIDISGPTKCYLMHAGGCHIAKGENGGAVLEGADVSSPAIMTITPVSDGYYTISASDGTFLSRTGQWNTVFSTDGTADAALVSVESAGSSFIKLRFKDNRLYLGTDNSEAGSNVYSNKNGIDSRHFWWLSDDVTAEPPADQYAYVINPSARRQTFDGWGVSLCWWANMCGKWSDDKIDEIVDWLVSPDGLNFSIFRYNIGGGDDPANTNCTPHHMGSGKGLRAEMEGFKDSSDGPYIWERDAAQRKIMLKIKERRPDAVFEAFSNSAPWYMTYSGCVAGNANAGKDNLRPEYYEEFANYLVDVCKHYKDEYGIEFVTLDPFNEPMTSYWGANGGQEGCHFDVNSQIEFIKVLYPILKKSGLNTVISASDETSVSQSVNDFIAYRNAGILDMVGQWNTHTYTADNNSRSRLSALCHEEGMRLWMSEVGAGGTGFGGNLNLARKLIDDMRYIQPSAWIDWQYIEENNDQWCLVKALSFAEGKYEKVRNYAVRSHFSRFIKKGYTILTTQNSTTLAALSPERDRLVVVAVNTGGIPTDHTLDLSMFAKVGSNVKGYITDSSRELEDFDGYKVGSKGVSFQLPGVCIVTLEIPVSVADDESEKPQGGIDYLVCPRTSADVVLNAEGGAVALRPVSVEGSSIWRLAASGDGFILTNAKGEILTENAPEYALVSKTEAGEGQVFMLHSLGQQYYRISNADGSKSLDLEGEKTADGTRVGVWKYDDKEAPVHRQWAFIRVPSDDIGLGVISIMQKEGEMSFPLTLVNEGEGLLRIIPEDSFYGDVRIYNASGICIYTADASEREVVVPLAAGFYIVAAGVDDRLASRVVAVR